jgi:hypothetical protein
MTDDMNNIARQPVNNGRFHPACLLEGVHGETKENALITFKNCFHKEVYGIVETVEEALEIRKYVPMVLWNGEMVRTLRDGEVW